MINSLLKAIAIMNLFSPDEPRLTLAEISRRLDIPKSTAHNLLNTLLSEGFIEKTDSDAYALGTHLITLTQSVRVNVELRDRAAPLLRQLADSCDESTYLTYRDGDYALYIYAVESSRRLMARTAVGDRVPLHCTSVGKAILAYLPHQEIRDIVQRVGLPAFTPHTITDPEALYTDLAAVRKQGFAIDRAEHEPGTYCLGAPVRDAQGRVIGACSLSGTDPGIVHERMLELSQQIMYTAQEISRRMGYVPQRISALVDIPPTWR